MKNFRIFYKLSFFIATILCFFSCALLLKLFLRSEQTRRRITSRLVSFLSSCCCKVFNINIKNNYQKTKDNYLIVSNHLSYIDTLVFSSILPVSFVTSIEMKNTFFLGQICKFSSCLFVERRSRGNLEQEIKEITEALNFGHNILIFPEGTSTNGDEVLRFKRPLFNCAIFAKKQILSATINYQESITNRDQICWYGDMGFFNHFLNFLARKETITEICYSKPITSENSTAEELSLLTQQLVSLNYQGFKNENKYFNSTAHSESFLPIHL